VTANLILTEPPEGRHILVHHERSARPAGEELAACTTLPSASKTVAAPAGERRQRPLDRRPGRHGASRTRTGDLLGAIQALSQLSYSPERTEV
jgi:hypothetical protein